MLSGPEEGYRDPEGFLLLHCEEKGFHLPLSPFLAHPILRPPSPQQSSKSDDWDLTSGFDFPAG